MGQTHYLDLEVPGPRTLGPQSGFRNLRIIRSDAVTPITETPTTGAASERRDVLADFPRRFRPARRLRRGDDWEAYTRRRVLSQAAFCLERDKARGTRQKSTPGSRFPKTHILGRLRQPLAECNEAIALVMQRMNDHPMRNLGLSRRELFEKIERDALIALPANWTGRAEKIFGESKLRPHPLSSTIRSFGLKLTLTSSPGSGNEAPFELNASTSSAPPSIRTRRRTIAPRKVASSMTPVSALRRRRAGRGAAPRAVARAPASLPPSPPR